LHEFVVSLSMQKNVESGFFQPPAAFLTQAAFFRFVFQCSINTSPSESL